MFKCTLTQTETRESLTELAKTWSVRVLGEATGCEKPHSSSGLPKKPSAANRTRYEYHIFPAAAGAEALPTSQSTPTACVVSCAGMVQAEPRESSPHLLVKMLRVFDTPEHHRYC